METIWRTYFVIYCKGVAMGAADVVPGVSGGTIAFISGIYTRLINALGRLGPHLIRTVRLHGWLAAWRELDGNFLLALGSGILSSVIALAGIIKYLLHNHPVLIGSFFFGLVAASVFMLLQSVAKWHVTTSAALLAGICLALLIAAAPILQGDHGLIFLFFAGALAICAMILPGISGAFILLILGAYERLLDAVHHFDVTVLAVTAAGAVCGLLTFTHLLKWLLAHYRALMMALLTGFVAGSLYKLWPWQADGYHLWPWQHATPHILPALAFMALGAVLVIGMSTIRHVQEGDRPAR